MMRDWTTFDEAGVDDVAFLRALIDAVAGRHGAHPDRAVVAGVSNGAFMARRIALEIGRFAEPCSCPRTAGGANMPAAMRP